MLSGIKTPNERLFAAAISGCVDEVERALILGAKIDAQDQHGDTALILAAKHRHFDMVLFLTRKNANRDGVNSLGQSALQVAAELGHIPMVQYLLSLGTVFDAFVKSEYTELDQRLVEAVKKGHADEIAKLLAKGANRNAQDANGDTPLIHAALLGDVDCLGVLLRRGAQRDLANYDSYNPLMMAAHMNKVAVVKMLVEYGANVNCRADKGYTPLMLAAQKGNLKAVKALLLAPHLDIEAANQYGNTALSLAILNGHNAVVAALLAADANPNSINSDGLTMLMLVGVIQDNHQRDVELIDLLLAYGANINLRGCGGNTALTMSMGKERFDLARCLIENHADVNALNDEGDFPLMEAVIADNVPIASVLLDAGATVDQCARTGATPLLAAMFKGQNPSMAQLLLEHGANREARDSRGNTVHSLAKRAGRRFVNLLKSSSKQVAAWSPRIAAR